MTSAITIEYPSVTLTTKILDRVNKLRNAKMTDPSINEITTSIHTLIKYSNIEFLKDIQVDTIYTTNNTIQTEIKSWCSPNLTLANIQEYIISTFENLESGSYQTQIEESNRCIDAICILVDYFNVVVLSRLNHYLELQEKRLDEFEQSSNSAETSTHLVNEDDFYE